MNKLEKVLFIQLVQESCRARHTRLMSREEFRDTLLSAMYGTECFDEHMLIEARKVCRTLLDKKLIAITELGFIKFSIQLLSYGLRKEVK